MVVKVISLVLILAVVCSQVFAAPPAVRLFFGRYSKVDAMTAPRLQMDSNNAKKNLTQILNLSNKTYT